MRPFVSAVRERPWLVSLCLVSGRFSVQPCTPVIIVFGVVACVSIPIRPTPIFYSIQFSSVQFIFRIEDRELVLLYLL